MSSTKFKRGIAAIAVVILAAFSLTTAVVSAASATDVGPAVPTETNISVVCTPGPVIRVVTHSTPGDGQTMPMIKATISDEGGNDQVQSGVAEADGVFSADFPVTNGDWYVVASANGWYVGDDTVTVDASTCATEPVVAPSVTGTLTGGLADNASVVNYDLTFDKGTGEGPWTITIEGPHGTVKTVPVQGSGPVKGSFPYACGEATFYVSVSGQDGYSSAQNVSIPCPVDNGGSTGGNTGGNTGGTTAPSTGGTTTPSTGGTTTTPVDNTTVPVGTNKVNAGATGDIQMPAASSTLLYLGITSLVVAAVILIVRRKLSGN